MTIAESLKAGGVWRKFLRVADHVLSLPGFYSSGFAISAPESHFVLPAGEQMQVARRLIRGRSAASVNGIDAEVNFVTSRLLQSTRQMPVSTCAALGAGLLPVA